MLALAADEDPDGLGDGVAPFTMIIKLRKMNRITKWIRSWERLP